MVFAQPSPLPFPERIGILTSKNSEVFMVAYATTKLSSKGQIVIPEDIRERLKLKEGDQFIVIGQGDSVILKSLTPPSLDEFKDLMAEARLAMKKARGKPSDVKAAIRKARRT
jgi:AbrB family looped-hinge helix DNA binding protein